jgi:hypothetical protein
MLIADTEIQIEIFSKEISDFSGSILVLKLLASYNMSKVTPDPHNIIGLLLRMIESNAKILNFFSDFP